MKGYRVLGELMLGLGCAVAFVGLLAFGLPLIDNDQLQLVLSSFAMPSRSLLINAVNGMMTFALHKCYLVMAVGAMVAVMGACLMLRHSPRATRPTVRSPYERPSQGRGTTRPPQTNRYERPITPAVNKAKRAVHPPVSESPSPNPFARYSEQPIDTQKTLFSSVEASRAAAYAPPEDWTKPTIPDVTDALSANAKRVEAPDQALYQPSMTETAFAPITTDSMEPSAPIADLGEKTAKEPDQTMYQPSMVAPSLTSVATGSTKPPAFSTAAQADEPSHSKMPSEKDTLAREPAAQETPSVQPPSRIRSTMGKHR